MEAKLKYRLGLDLGIGSVGWAVIQNDDTGNPIKIERLGVRVFTPAENPKDGSSLTVERRMARGARRLLRRKKERVFKLKSLLSKQFNIQDIDNIYANIEDVYQLRYRGLDYLLTNEQLIKVILNIAKHRGFQSNRKSELKESETGKLLKGVSENKECLISNKYRSYGEMLYLDSKFSNTIRLGEDELKRYSIRNKDGQYLKTLDRKGLYEELLLLLNTQKTLGNKNINKEFIDDVLRIFLHQRSYDEGPANPSPYRVSFKVGECTFIKNEKRATKASFTFEYFNFLTKLNNLKIIKIFEVRDLTPEEKMLITSKFLSTKDICFKDIRKILKLNETEFFNLLTYNLSKKDIEKGESQLKCENTKFATRVASYEICKVLNLDKAMENEKLINAIGFILSMNKSDNKRIIAFNDNPLTKGLSSEHKDALLVLDYSKFGNLSILAMSQIIPFLEKGNRYDKACELAGYQHSNLSGNEKYKFLENDKLKEELKNITSPVVKRTVAQTIKLVNAVIREYGSPEAIFIELSREMSKPLDERRKIENSQQERAIENEKIITDLKEKGLLKPNGQDIVKMRLYYEQNGKCAYSQKSFDETLGGMQNIFNNNNTQIDHIIPYSKCYDDSYQNKVLVLSNENQQKGNKLPFEYIGHDTQRWQNFENFVLTNYKNKRKIKNLLMKSISEETEKELNQRALVDTQYIAKFMMNLFQNNLNFSNSNKFSKKPVRAVNGTMTNYLRKIWGMTKVRFENDKHHAMDACVVACCTNDMIQTVTKYLKAKSEFFYKPTLYDNNGGYIHKYTNEKLTKQEFDNLELPNIRYPYFNFIDEMRILLSGRIEGEFIKVADGWHAMNDSSSNGDGKIRRLLEMGYDEEEISNIKPIFISRMPNRKMKGVIHKATVRSNKLNKTDEKGLNILTCKTAITDLKLTKDNEIKDYPEEYKKSDPKLYQSLKQQLINFNGDAKLAFKDGFYKPSNNENTKNLVKTVKLESKVNGGITLKNGGVVEQSSIVRIDLFEKDKKIYIVPIYISDFYKGVLPNKVVTLDKSKDQWEEINECFNFMFSLCQYDLVKVSRKTPMIGTGILNKEIKKEFNDTYFYFNSLDSSTSLINLYTSDKGYLLRGVGIKLNTTIEKYQVDVLGNVTKVKREKRMPLTHNAY